MNRRLAIGTVAAGAMAFGRPQILPRRAITQRGMVGGGLVHFEDHEAQFSLFASRFTIADEPADIVVGSILWMDTEAGLTFASTEVTAYDIIDIGAEVGETRRIRGLFTVNGRETYPFVLNVTDAGPIGEGTDSIALIVGKGVEAQAAPGDDFSYAAAGEIVVGDVQEVDLEMALTTPDEPA
jgi:hypothetical protein